MSLCKHALGVVDFLSGIKFLVMAHKEACVLESQLSLSKHGLGVDFLCGINLPTTAPRRHVY